MHGLGCVLARSSQQHTLSNTIGLSLRSAGVICNGVHACCILPIWQRGRLGGALLDNPLATGQRRWKLWEERAWWVDDIASVKENQGMCAGGTMGGVWAIGCYLDGLFLVPGESYSMPCHAITVPMSFPGKRGGLGASSIVEP